VQPTETPGRRYAASMPTQPLRIGVASLIEHPIAQLAERAATLEGLGYDDIWVPDERLLRNVYISLAAVAGATSRVGLGTAVTNPYTRHPVITAAAIATIDEMSGGRATLALGAGGGLPAYGIERRDPVGTLRETIAIIRRLTAGESVTMSGKHFSLLDAHLDFPPVRQVPIYLAARGPRILQLAGEVADGVIIGGFTSRSGLGFAQGLVERGLERGNRSWSDVDQMAWVYVSAAREHDAARVAVSKQVLASLITSRGILDEIGIELPAALRTHLDATGWAYPRETPQQAADLLPDVIVDAFSVHGTPAECVAGLREIQACGIQHIGLVLFPPEGQTVTGLAQLLSDEVASVLRTS
jgi:5,10-methylenetetrahydromethanopterin reductase